MPLTAHILTLKQTQLRVRPGRISVRAGTGHGGLRPTQLPCWAALEPEVCRSCVSASEWRHVQALAPLMHVL